MFNKECKHDWEIVTEKVLESPAEQSASMLKEADNVPSWFFEKKYICILRCKLCGKLDKTIETNP